MPLSPQERLEAELGITADDLGLDAAAYNARWMTWQAIAEEDAQEPKRQLAVVKTLLLRTWITVLARKADEFRAEGDATIKRNMMARIALLKADLDAALLLTLPPVPVSDPADAAFGPLIGEWGVGT